MILKRLSCNGEHIIFMKAHGCIVMVMGAILSGVPMLVTVEDEKSVLFELFSSFYVLYTTGKANLIC